MTIGVFGGSFDPPHVGHVLALHYLFSIGEVSQVIIVPVYDHALHKPLSSYDVRLRLCDAAFGFQSGALPPERRDFPVTVSRIERELPRPSYTLRTLRALRQRHAGDDWRLIIGTDVLRETEKWHRFDEVAALAPPLILGRVGYPHQSAPIGVLPEVSSTAIRKSIADGDAESRRMVEAAVPVSVLRLIDQLGLYR